jgi:hypothetical protein
MTLPIHRVTVPVLVATALAVSPAGALEDLTGSWLGTRTCDSVSTLEHEKTKENVTLVIDDDPSGNAFLNLQGVTYHVAVLADPDAPAKGRVGGQECNANPDSGVDALALTAKAKDGSAKGTLSGDLLSVRTGDVPRVTVCKLKLKRASTTIETPITDCPL